MMLNMSCSLSCPLPKEEQSICFSQTRVEHRAKISARVELAIRSPERFAQWPARDCLLSAPALDQAGALDIEGEQMKIWLLPRGAPGPTPPSHRRVTSLDCSPTPAE